MRYRNYLIRFPATIPDCGHNHRSYATRAACAWKVGKRPVVRRSEVFGDGPYGVLVQFDSYGSPAFYCRLHLFETKDEATAKLRHEASTRSGSQLQEGLVTFR